MNVLICALIPIALITLAAADAARAVEAIEFGGARRARSWLPVTCLGPLSRATVGRTGLFQGGGLTGH